MEEKEWKHFRGTRTLRVIVCLFLFLDLALAWFVVTQPLHH